MTIKVKGFSLKHLIPVKVECSHQETSLFNLEHHADTFEDDNYYPDFYTEQVSRCNNCHMYFNETLQCWDVLNG